jgi:hypothetical protein
MFSLCHTPDAVAIIVTNKSNKNEDGFPARTALPVHFSPTEASTAAEFFIQPVSSGRFQKPAAATTAAAAVV